MQDEQGEEAVGVELAAEIHIRIPAIAVHTIKQRLGKGEIDLDPTGQAPLVVMDRAVAVLPQQLVERPDAALVVADQKDATRLGPQPIHYSLWARNNVYLFILTITGIYQPCTGQVRDKESSTRG